MKKGKYLSFMLIVVAVITGVSATTYANEVVENTTPSIEATQTDTSNDESIDSEVVEDSTTQENNTDETNSTDKENVSYSNQVENDSTNQTTNNAPVSKAKSIAITPASIDFTSLKTQIESATTDVTINLDPGVYTFDGKIQNNNNIKVTLVGATDATGQPATQFIMDSTVATAVRFIYLESGTLEINNIKVTGTKNKNGGVSAKNVITNNAIYENNFVDDGGVSGGGAIRVTGGYLNVESSSFIGNSVGIGKDGGAISSEYSGSIKINNSIFDSNERVGNSNQYGGAISVKQPGVDNTTIEITNSVFRNNLLNAAGNLSTGGAVRIFGTNKLVDVKIDNNLFKANRAQNSLTSNGGALAFMAVTSKSVVSNNTFVDNYAGKYGGAVYYENTTGDHKIINSTFVGNTSLFSGSGISTYSSTIKVDSSTFINNTFSTPGTNPKIEISNSIVAGSSTNESSTIIYSGINLAKKNNGEPTVDPSSVFKAYTSDTLVEVSKSNFVAPILEMGPAYKKISDTRLLSNAQNGIARKAPLSDIGAYEAGNYFKVDFDSNGGTAVATQNVIEDGLATMPIQPAKSNLVFDGWFTDNTTFSNRWDFATNTVTSDITLYAKWSTQKYTLSFDTVNAYSITPQSQLLEENQLATSVDNPEKLGYTFVSWNTTIDGSGETWDFATSKMPANNVTLYAQWKINTYKITFNSNGGYGTMLNEEYNYLESKKLFKNEFKRDGYTFTGWSISKNTAVSYKDESSYSYDKTSDIVLYAQWTANTYKINFDANDGTGSMIPETFKYGETKQLSKNQFKRDSYVFKGWSTTSTGKVLYKDQASFKYNKTSDTTLYAVWESDGLKPVPNGGYNPTIIIITLATLSISSVIMVKRRNN